MTGQAVHGMFKKALLHPARPTRAETRIFPVARPQRANNRDVLLLSTSQGGSDARTTLEAFCNTGAFGIHAALHGAASVLGLDVSRDAIAQARDHAASNKVEGRCEYREADAFEELRRIERAGARFDLVILDPPSFARTKQAVPQALAGYKQINLRALRLVGPEGFLVSCSCSHHVSEEQFWSMLQDAAHDARRQLRLIERRSQARDHPVLAAMPETRYLKCVIAQVV